VAQRRKKASPKPGSRSPQQTVESLRRSLTREREQRREALEREREALERQTATADILKVISSSPTDVQPVFRTMGESVRRLCGAQVSVISRFDGELLQLAEVHVAEGGEEDARAMFPMRADAETMSARAFRSRAVVHVADVLAEAAYPLKHQARAGRWRGALAVPMIREGQVMGVIGVGREEPGLFSESQVELLKTFADQAVIAIENVRLFNETKEALERQKATGEILASISRAIDDTQPVFDAIVESLRRLLNTHYAVVSLIEDGKGMWKAMSGDKRVTDRIKAAYPWPVNDERRLVSRAIRSGEVVQLCPLAGNPEAPEASRQIAFESGYDAILVAPLVRADRVIGYIVTTRAEAIPFDEKQVALIKSFADQAVIAIENARLFNETKEALARQTATADILRVISSSMTDAQPVFETVAESAVRLCEADKAFMFRFDGEVLRAVVAYNASQELREFVERNPIRPGSHSAVARAAVERRTVHIPDVMADPNYTYGAKNLDPIRTVLTVPMLKGEELLGVITIYRLEVRPFTDKQIALIETFARQAVIAIENMRLFNETKEALDHQTSTAEVLKTISRSTFDLQAVLQTLLDNATRLSGAERAVMLRPDAEGNYFPALTFNLDPALVARLRERPIRPGRDSINGRVLLEKTPIHVPDVLADPEYGRQDLVDVGRYRTVLSVPMLRDDEAIGLISLNKGPQVDPFTERQMELVTTFADQAVIAIENVRLFNETKEALDQQKAAGDVLRVISSSIADTKPVFDKILESCQQLFAGRNVGINVVGDDGKVHIGAYKGHGSAELEAYFPVPLSMQSGSGAAIVQRQVVHYPDCDAAGVPEYARRGAHIAGNRSVLFAPMLWEGMGIGAIFVGRPVTGPFSEKEIALLRTFADQAAIAIQNAKLFREIQEKSAQLEVANKHKSDFLANMSHELRTPLNAIIGFSEALMDRLFGDLNEKQLEYQKDIHESGKHLLSLINDILDLSKIEAGRMDLELSTFHLPTAVSNAVTLIRERALRHGIALGVDIDPRLGDFQADERKVKQILLNLLSNAVKFTPDGGRVDVSAKLDTDKVEIAVKDTGVGIAPEDQASLFEEFKQLGKDSSRKAEGTGLGLALTKRLVELHGGQILVDSAVGHGSTFRVMLPVQH
jgi:GAF domain-containing protein